MNQRLQITFRDMDASDALRSAISDRAAELERFCGDIMSCRVMVESPHRHHQKGQLYHVRIELTVPGEEIMVNRNPGDDHAHEDVHVALRDAFHAARRELQDHVRRRRSQVKAHEGPPHAIVSRLFPYEGYGFLTTADGREIYFHRNSVLGAFDELELGTEVRFAEEMGAEGPQASSVTPVGKSGHLAL